MSLSLGRSRCPTNPCADPGVRQPGSIGPRSTRKDYREELDQPVYPKEPGPPYLARPWFPLLKIPAIKDILPANRWNFDEFGLIEGQGINGLVVGSAHIHAQCNGKSLVRVRRPPS
ncbi:uncharacterized protein B0T15DRAFT_357 [Chaetomium strumarium]|uniref:Uncharacterized protein n=1 Tax=Chaetomium strumarium TaxID=1170767 RepID=A0AAJ0M514_9PEZI|nr:hypothetical protein B0T15DRAFT_357 [Chaetomium strumarium]